MRNINLCIINNIISIILFAVLSIATLQFFLEEIIIILLFFKLIFKIIITLSLNIIN